MEDNSAKVAKMTRILAIAHLIVGLLLICLGIADRVVEFTDFSYSSTGNVYFGIWTGAWVSIIYDKLGEYCIKIAFDCCKEMKDYR